MILQALTQHYYALAQRGEACPPGWSEAKVGYALVLDEQGVLQQLFPLKAETAASKGKPVPVLLRVPQQEGRSSGPKPYFLCDNATYMLGLGEPGQAEKTQERFALAAARHTGLLTQTDHPAAQAVCNFFRTWRPEQAAQCPLLEQAMPELLAGANLVFRFNGRFVHEEPAVRAVWQAACAVSDAPVGRCSVTGVRGPIARLHPSIKGILGAQSSGAALVSFNAASFCSRGKDQGLNAPVSEEATFAYTTALNTLLRDTNHVKRVGDTTLIYWAKCAEPACQDFFGGLLDPQGGNLDRDLQAAMAALVQGLPFDYEGLTLHPEENFYILGLSPNAARLSVRLFLHNTLGGFAQNIARHYSDLEITQPAFDKRVLLPIWSLLRETVNPNARDRSAQPALTGAVLRAVLSGSAYPRDLYQDVLLRIRAEREITRGRAAIIKAFLLRNPSTSDSIKEVLTVELNETARDRAYSLGRLFAVLENIQETALPDLNATIKDRYFNGACETPAGAFPTLIKLANSHLKVIRRDKQGLAVKLDRQMRSLLDDRFDRRFPAHLSIDEQGSFILGYYQQTQSRYAPKHKEEN